MKMTKSYCDGCNREISGHWEETCNYFKLESSQSCQNPLKEISNVKESNHQTVKIEFLDVCSSCIRDLNSKITEILKQFKFQGNHKIN